MKRPSLLIFCVLLSIQHWAFAQHFNKKNIERYMGHLYHQSQKNHPQR